MVDAMVDAAMAEFKQILNRFCEKRDLSKLTPELAEQLCGGLREALAGAGLEAFRTFLQSYETELDVVRDTHGKMYRFKKVRNRSFMTPFGLLNLKRRCYQDKRDTTSYVPLDAAWGMEGQYLTPQVREAVLFACALVTPEETVQLLGKCALFKPDPSTIKREVVNTGKRIQAQRDAVDQQLRAEEPVPEESRALVVSADGATVLMNEKGVHFGRCAERPGGNESGQRPTAYRVAMVGSVSHYGAPEAPGESPKRLQTRYVAHMPERGCPTFKSLLEAELEHAERHAPAQAQRILLLDGARELWSYFDKNPRYDTYHRCIDFWHTMEHLSVAAHALHGNGEAAKRWYDKYSRILLESDDGAQRICRSIDYYEPKIKRTKTNQKHLEEQRTFFRRNGCRMPYATFRTNGWPIGSGPIEAACKTLVKTRMCRSGMRWTRSGGQHILNLRTYVKSNRWSQAWQHIKQLENAA
ncbi:MAG: hypothetical protein RBU21_22285 [FCB group bacterium]|jgi:hypothetical protein|nr:hypothetical protein [FCB group bacterium]